MMFLDGSTRLFPSWEIRLWGHTVSPLFWPTVVLPGILLTLAVGYPFVEAKMTRDTKPHNLLQRPRDVPVRTSLGVMALTFYLVLTVSGGNDILAKAFDISLNAMTWAGRILLLVAPPILYIITYRICLGLQRHDREVLEHGVETGIIKVLPNGEFIEVHQPLGPVDEHGHGRLSYAGTPVPKRMNQLGAGAPLRHIRGFFYPVKEKPEIQAALDEARGQRGRPARRAAPADGLTRDRAGRLAAVLQVLVDADNVAPPRLGPVLALLARVEGEVRLTASGRPQALAALPWPAGAELLAHEGWQRADLALAAAYRAGDDPLVLVTGDGDFALLAERHPGPVLVVSGAPSGRLRDTATIVDPAMDGADAIGQWLAANGVALRGDAPDEPGDRG